MAISDDLVRQSISALSKVDGIKMDPRALAEDCLLLTCVFGDEVDFRAAVANTCKALTLLAQGRVDTSGLKYDYKEWRSYHYQHKIARGARADMRIMYQCKDGSVFVRGFGHRDIPLDFYKRMSEARRR